MVPRIRQSGDGGGGGEGGFVFAGEFLEAVHGSWGASEDRFVGKVTLNVGGEGAGRFVAPAAVFFEGFHHDPIELAAERCRNAAGIGAAALGDRGQGWGLERAHAGAGRGGSSSRIIRRISSRPALLRVSLSKGVVPVSSS